MKRFYLPILFLLFLFACKKDDPVTKPKVEPPVEPPVTTVTQTGLITTDKDFPSAGNSFTLIFTPSKGNGVLNNFSGDIYVHWGVITNISKNGSDWKYVKSSSFNSPDPSSKMTRQSNGTYTISITPQSFFGVPASEQIQKIAMLFRNGDGSLVGRNSDGSDIFLSLYSGSLQARFLRPEMNPTLVISPLISNAAVGTQIEVTGIASQSANLKLTINDIEFATVSNATQITGKATVSNVGEQTVKILANGNVQESFTFIGSGTVASAALPTGANENGITFLNGGTSMILALYAPEKTYVYAVGDFNEWKATSNSFMKRTPDGNTWWVQIDGLDPNKEYTYQFWVEGNLKIADPYTEKVLDPGSDSQIPGTNNSNFGIYPLGKTTGIVSTFKGNQTVYNWQHNLTRPAKNNLVIYELLVRDFLGSNNFKTMADTVSYLSNLGVNAVELMPVNEFEGNSSWGYNPDFYFAPDKYYGNKQDLQKFIDLCHSKGIAVILDVVFNHSMSLSPMAQLYWDGANNRPATKSPWYNTVAPHSAITFGYDFNHDSPATKTFVKNVLDFWLQEYKIDGYRFDFTKGFTQNQTSSVEQMGVYDPDRIAILKDYNNHIKAKDPSAYVILEHFCEDKEEKELAGEGMMMWNNLNGNFNEATMGWLENDKSDLKRSDYKTHGFTNADGLITYMESHDEERLMFKNLTYGNAASGYNIKNLSTALKRQELAAAFLFAIPGPKMIWQFGELGYDISINENGRIGEKPVLWTYNTNPDRVALKNVYAKLIKLKTKNSIFSTSNYSYILNSGFKYINLKEGAKTFVVVGNFDVVPQNATLSMGSAGIWYDVMDNNKSFNLAGSSFTVTLAPGEYHLFSNFMMNQ